uniref:HAT C-terminal dimerisation domain-containing protein n=1 Tax=Fagus sylvatica TaxID=28930 RepID=A0A2N9HNP8_FAGSY
MPANPNPPQPISIKINKITNRTQPQPCYPDVAKESIGEAESVWQFFDCGLARSPQLRSTRVSPTLRSSPSLQPQGHHDLLVHRYSGVMGLTRRLLISCFVNGNINGFPISAVEHARGTHVEEDNGITWTEIVLDSPSYGEGTLVAKIDGYPDLVTGPEIDASRLDAAGPEQLSLTPYASTAGPELDASRFDPSSTSHAWTRAKEARIAGLKMVETKKNVVYPLVYLLVTLALTLPVATATVERAFSAMKIVKNRLHSQMSDQ